MAVRRNDKCRRHQAADGRLGVVEVTLRRGTLGTHKVRQTAYRRRKNLRPVANLRTTVRVVRHRAVHLEPEVHHPTQHLTRPRRNVRDTIVHRCTLCLRHHTEVVTAHTILHRPEPCPCLNSSSRTQRLQVRRAIPKSLLHIIDAHRRSDFITRICHYALIVTIL